MKTLAELNDDIVKISNSINDDYPEISEYANEFTITLPDDSNPEITIENLAGYKESLHLLLEKYKKNMLR